MAGTAAVGSSGDAAVDGLLQPSRWVGPVSFGFPESAAAYAADSREARDGFAAVSGAQVEAARAALTGGGGGAVLGTMSVAFFTGLVLVEAGSGADIRIAQSARPGTAYGFFPAEEPAGGDVWFGTHYAYRDAALGNYGYHAMLHELGHALGLKHPQDIGGITDRAVPTGWDGVEFTVMSYRAVIGGPRSGYGYEDWGAPQSYMMLDIAALQSMYGADFSAQAGDTVYAWDERSGELRIDGAGQGRPGANRVFMTLWDGGGHDSYDLSNFADGVSIDLRPGGWSITALDQRAQLSDGMLARGTVFNALQYHDDPRSLIEDAIGGDGNDRILGNDADNRLVGGAGDDWLDGGAGDDRLVAGGGRDTASGGAGTDTLVLPGFRHQTAMDRFSGIEVFDFRDGRLVLDPDDPLAAVARLYAAALGRDPDAGGMQFWTDAGLDLAGIARGLAGSAEAQARYGGASDAGFVAQVYRTVLGREAEAGGLGWWVAQLEAGAGREAVLTGFSESAENRAKTAGLLAAGLWDADAGVAGVARLYQAVLGRRPDESGLDWWAGQGDGLREIAGGMMRSPEFLARFGDPDDAGFLAQLYAQVLGRDGDADGAAHWLDALAAGLDRAGLVVEFSDSAEFRAATAPWIDSGIIFA